MICGSLHNNITLVHRRFHTIVENELDSSLQNHSEIDALSSMHDVDVVFCIPCRGKVYNAAVDTYRTHQADLLSMYVGPRTLCFCRNSIRSEKVGKSWDDTGWGISFGVKRIRGC